MNGVKKASETKGFIGLADNLRACLPGLHGKSAETLAQPYVQPIPRLPPLPGFIVKTAHCGQLFYIIRKIAVED